MDEFNPYAAPKAPLARPAAPAVATQPAAIRPIRARANWASGLLFVDVVLSAIVAGLAFVEYSLLEATRGGRATTAEEFQAVDGALGLAALAKLGVLIPTVVAWGMWKYRAYANLSALGARWLRGGPGMAVGSYFIPIYNLFGPYRYMVELWKASDPGVGVTTPSSRWAVRSPALIGLWWAAWILSGLIGQLLFRLSRDVGDDPPIDTLIGLSGLTIANHAADLVAGLLAVGVVRKLTSRQEMKIYKLDSLMAPATGPAAGGDPGADPILHILS
jgi:hypothetical protein